MHMLLLPCPVSSSSPPPSIHRVTWTGVLPIFSVASFLVDQAKLWSHACRTLYEWQGASARMSMQLCTQTDIYELLNKSNTRNITEPKPGPNVTHNGREPPCMHACTSKETYRKGSNRNVIQLDSPGVDWLVVVVVAKQTVSWRAADF